MDLATRLQVLGAVALAAIAGARLLRSYVSRETYPRRFDRSDVGANDAGKMLVEFTSPYCYECQLALPILEQASHRYGTPLAVIDAKERPDLLAKYEIRSTPVILVVDDKGAVKRTWSSKPSFSELAEALA